MNKLRTVLLAAAILASVPTMAQTPAYSPWYVGIGAGGGNLAKSGTDLTGLNNATVDDTDTTYTVRGGYRFSPYFALELGYYDLGTYNFTGSVGNTIITGSAKAKSYGLSAVGILPIDMFDLYARIGWEESEIKANANTALATAGASDRQNGATYGVGARWNASRNWGLFAEWMKNDKLEVDSYLFGVDFKF